MASSKRTQARSTVSRKTAVKLDPALWEKAKAFGLVRASKRRVEAGLEPVWSARAAQLAVQYYKAHGGRYEGQKTGKESLSRWTNEEWQTRPGTSPIAFRGPGNRAASANSPTTARYLPKRAWVKLSASERRATDEKKRAACRGDKDACVILNTRNAKRAGIAARAMRGLAAGAAAVLSAVGPAVAELLIELEKKTDYEVDIEANSRLLNVSVVDPETDDLLGLFRVERTPIDDEVRDAWKWVKGCRDAWENADQKPFWVVKESEWYDDSLKGRGLGVLAYRALVEYALERGGIVGPDRCAGGTTSDEAMRVWKSLCRLYRCDGPLVVDRRR